MRYGRSSQRGRQGVIASIESAEAMKLLAGHPEALNDKLISCDVWSGRFQSIRVGRAIRIAALACGANSFHLEGARPVRT